MSNNRTEKPILNALASGTVIEGAEFSYRVVKVLGQGNFGITYLVELIGKSGQATNIFMAMKEFFMRDFNGREGTLVTSSSDSGLFHDYRRKFIREAENMAGMKHENIVHVSEWFEANDTVYFVMSYIAGSNLNDLIDSRGALPEHQALEIASDLSDALRYLHSRGMVHLDVKPGNVMLISDRVPMLIDFGLSKHFSENGEPETSTRIGAGTPGYAPLEQPCFRPGKMMPLAIDVYALGATMFKMLTGQRPPDASDIFNSGFPEDKLIAAGVSRPTIDLVKKGMEPSLKTRFSSMDEMGDEIKRILKERYGKQGNEIYIDPEKAIMAEVNPIPADESPKGTPKQPAEERPLMAEVVMATPEDVQSAQHKDTEVITEVVPTDDPVHEYAEELEEEDSERRKIPVVVYILSALAIIAAALCIYFFVIGTEKHVETVIEDTTSESIGRPAETDSIPAVAAPVTVPEEKVETQKTPVEKKRKEATGKGKERAEKPMANPAETEPSAPQAAPSAGNESESKLKKTATQEPSSAPAATIPNKLKKGNSSTEAQGAPE